MTENTIVNFTDTATGWQKVFYAFLAEKEQSSCSRRTAESYSRMLQDFFGRSGKQPHNVTSQDIFVYAHSPVLSGKQPSAPTIGSRIACVSSFFRFLIRMDIVQANPCDKLQRPQTSPSTPRGLSSDQVHQLLAVVPNSPVGLRDRAIILTLVLTGRRRAEVIGMKAGNLFLDGERAFYTYRGKGGKQGHRELPQPALNAIRASLTAFGKGLATMPADESLWPSKSSKDKGLTSGTFYGNLRRYFKKIEEAIELFSNLPMLWSEATTEEKRVLLKSLVELVYLDIKTKTVTGIKPTPAFLALYGVGINSGPDTPVKLMFHDKTSIKLDLVETGESKSIPETTIFRFAGQF